MAETKKDAKTISAQSISRPPVVVVLGHIDHGKTTLLDFIRKTKVAPGEAGGITQKIGAYQAQAGGKLLTFIDTPGHAAFSKMRERGAAVADVAILVVAADDGVKPQTVEAIAHAKAADVPLVVALSKMDLAPKEAPLKVKGQLAKEGVVAEEQGGDVPVVAVSAKTGEGVDKLLEVVGLVGDLLELKSNPSSPLEAVVIESILSPKQGPLATVVVKDGTLKVGEEISAGGTAGKVKALLDERGTRLTQAGPGMPVQILGFSAVAPVGAEVHKGTEVTQPAGPAASLTAGEAPAEGLNLIVRAESEGSLEALVAAISNLEAEGKRANILLKAVGPVADSDVRLASASSSLILGFNVPVISSAKKLAEDFGVGVRTFKIIYELLEVVEKLLTGYQALEEQKKAPEAEVIAVFKLHSGDIVAGAKILNGKFKYRDRVDVVRAGEVVAQGKIRGLKVGKDEVTQASGGQEAGILIKPQFEVKKGDRLVIP
ncbi:MAG: translation initiation factor IF-2 [Patescibacteria group bacterium]